MVQGTLHLDDGETVIIVADDMLSALKLANEKYYGKTRKMDFKTVEKATFQNEHSVGYGGLCKCGVYIFDVTQHEECPNCGRVL